MQARAIREISSGGTDMNPSFDHDTANAIGNTKSPATQTSVTETPTTLRSSPVAAVIGDYGPDFYNLKFGAAFTNINGKLYCPPVHRLIATRSCLRVPGQSGNLVFLSRIGKESNCHATAVIAQNQGSRIRVGLTRSR